mmetsp:Transcript_55427/g.121241  ORF Transcript_55427/g.121241 Transcript_55427/m.121241 type:complete len:119 (+) Transcript_55427:3355-3711(+)
MKRLGLICRTLPVAWRGGDDEEEHVCFDVEADPEGADADADAVADIATVETPPYSAAFTLPSTPSSNPAELGIVEFEACSAGAGAPSLALDSQTCRFEKSAASALIGEKDPAELPVGL